MKAPRITRRDLVASVPDMTSTFRVRGLEATVELFRDSFGIPHVRARSRHDAFFGQGFVTAQDRLWQMDYLRRWGYGRWAEFVGKAGLEQDKRMRRFQIEPSVKSDFDAVDTPTREMLAAYASGVNAFIATTEILPIEYAIVGGKPEKWQPWDCLAVYKARHVIMGVVDSKRWRARLVSLLGPRKTSQIIGSLPADCQLVVAPGGKNEGPVLDSLKELAAGASAIRWFEERQSGSNNWVLSGRRTSTGKPILAGDPHRPVSTPNIYYQNHIACGDFDVIGLSFPGCPAFSHYGHNTRVAWTVTNAETDYQDLYIERFKEGDPEKYLYRGRWRQAEVHSEAIRQRGGRPVTIEVTRTHHGPVIAGDPAQGYGLAFKYTANAGVDRGAECFLKMLMAKDVYEFDESARDWVNPGNNLVFADTSGNIAYLDRSKVPVRSISNFWIPVPGWTGSHEWKGYVPFDKLPRARNPKAGHFVTANNRIVGDDYPYMLAVEYAPEWRARRVATRLQSLPKKATVEDVAAIQSDRVSIPAQQYQLLLAEIKPLDALSRCALEILARWDCSMDKDQVAPTIYAAFRHRLDWMVAGHILEYAAKASSNTKEADVDLMVRLATFLSVPVLESARQNDTSLLPAGECWHEWMVRALSDATADLRQRLGPDPDAWHWGKVHQLESSHLLSEVFPELGRLLDPPKMPMGGDGDTPQQGHYAPDQPFKMTALQVARMVFDLSDWDNSGWVVPFGSSGHAGSSHYTDQMEPWSTLRLVPMLYSWERIKAQSTYYQTLECR